MARELKPDDIVTASDMVDLFKTFPYDMPVAVQRDAEGNFWLPLRGRDLKAVGMANGEEQECFGIAWLAFTHPSGVKWVVI